VANPVEVQKRGCRKRVTMGLPEVGCEDMNWIKLAKEHVHLWV
jgi:hypothetical protein